MHVAAAARGQELNDTTPEHPFLNHHIICLQTIYLNYAYTDMSVRHQPLMKENKLS